MAQVLDLINDAAALIGELDSTSPLDAADVTLCFRALNRMLDTWNSNRSFLFETRLRTITLTNGVGAYSSTLLGARPTNIDAQNILDSSNVEHYLELVDADKWATRSYTGEPGYPYWCFIDDAYPNATFNFYPVPFAGLTAQFWCRELLTAFTSTAQTVSFPPGYEDAIVYNLALRIAPMFGRTDINPMVIETAGEGKRFIEAQNLPATELSTALVPTSTKGWFNWRSGEIE